MRPHYESGVYTLFSLVVVGERAWGAAKEHVVLIGVREWKKIYPPLGTLIPLSSIGPMYIYT